jgi:hypothetical protein
MHLYPYTSIVQDTGNILHVSLSRELFRGGGGGGGWRLPPPLPKDVPYIIIMYMYMFTCSQNFLSKGVRGKIAKWECGQESPEVASESEVVNIKIFHEGMPPDP